MNVESLKLSIPDELCPSLWRMLFRRTLYLRILDGSFILWCYETNRQIQKETDLLDHPRIAVTDQRSFVRILIQAMKEVGVRRFSFKQMILIVHSFRSFDDDLTPLEKQAFDEIRVRSGGSETFILPKEQKIEITNTEVVTMCHEVGELRRKLKKIPKNEKAYQGSADNADKPRV